MTDLQVKAQANEIAEEKNKIELLKHRETQRANKAKEMYTDLENLAQYGAVRYTPVTDQGWYHRNSVAGKTDLPGRIIESLLGGGVATVAKSVH